MTTPHVPLGRVIGVAGQGLTRHAEWLGTEESSRSAAAVGIAGEIRTAEALRFLTESPSGPTVLHDLMMPSQRYKANLDHVIVSGSRVLVLDSKVWKPGFYLTVSGRTFRSGKRFAPAEKRTMVIAKRAIESYLDTRGAQAEVLSPALVVWPSRTGGSIQLGLLRVPGARVWRAHTLRRRINRAIGRPRPADPRIVAALAELLEAHQTPPASPAHSTDDEQPVLPDHLTRGG